MTRANDMANVLPTFNEVIGSSATFPAGHVLQVQFGHLKDNFTTTTAGEWINTGLDVTITPSSTSNKIYIQASVAGVGNSASGYNTRVSILQPFANSDSNVILSTSASPSTDYHDYNAQGPVPGGNGVFRTYTWGGFHSPSSTSALTYVVGIKGEGSGTSRTHYFNQGHSSAACYCGITAWEVAG